MKIPFHRPLLGEAETAATAEVLRSGWLTSGPRVEAFEKRLAELTGMPHALAVNSCTSALFLIQKALGIGPGDEVITTPITFAASANTTLHCGATPVFADIDPLTGNLDPAAAEAKINSRTKAVLAVHLGGNACDLDALQAICKKHSLLLIEDCAHTLNGTYHGRQLGSFGIASAFSFYPTKIITTGEGGMALTGDPVLAEKIRLLRMHGMNKSLWLRSQGKTQPEYDIVEAGYKMNLGDLQASIGLVQLDRLGTITGNLMNIRKRYDEAFSSIPGIRLVQITEGSSAPLHLYMILISEKGAGMSRDTFTQKLNEKGIGYSQNYLPLHLMTYYRNKFGARQGDFPNAERWAEETISLPFFADLREEEVEYLIAAVKEILR